MRRTVVLSAILAGSWLVCGTSYADLSEGLVAYWPFNGNANDESGNPNHGTVNGASLTEDRCGTPNSAYSFDGANDYVSIDKVIISGDTYTYSMWVKRERTGLTDDTILCHWSNNAGGPALIDWGVKSADEIRFLAGRWQSGLIRLFGYHSVSTDWTNIALVRTGGSAFFYIDGSEVGSTSSVPPAYSTSTFDIGRYPNAERYFSGLIDDIRIYSRALSSDEIGELISPNVSPVADAGGPYLSAVGQAIVLDGSASYDENGDPLVYQWTEVEALGDFSSSSSESPAYVGRQAGITELILTVDDGQEHNSDTTMLVVYDPSAGFVTGGGWIWSPISPYPYMTVEGRANFGFVSKYKKGAAEPMGTTEFQFAAGDLNFHSISYDWLVVTGSNYARFKGSGTINGSGDHKFMLWAGDGPDTFRIRIWTEDAAGSETDVYDNGMDQPIGGGSIVIHTN